MVRAKQPRELSEDICDLLQTFANQSAIAIANARLFGQIEQKNTQLRGFLPKQVGGLVIGDGDPTKLTPHREEIAVVFCDLRGFTSFAELAEFEEVMAVLHGMHRAFGGLIDKYDGTLERFTGDGLMVFFNDPIPQENYCLRAIHMAVEMQAAARELAQVWVRTGFELALGIGIDEGHATLGSIGFEGRTDYAAIGSVTNRAARLCDVAEPWQTLVTERVAAYADDSVDTNFVDERQLKGLTKKVRFYEVTGADKPSDGEG